MGKPGFIGSIPSFVDLLYDGGRVSTDLHSRRAGEMG